MGYVLFRLLCGFAAILAAALLIIDSLICAFDESKGTMFCLVYGCGQKGMDYIVIAFIYCVITALGTWIAFSKG